VSDESVSGYFFDNNVSPHLVEAMKLFGEPVHHMRDLYPGGDPGDPVWIPKISQLGYVLVTYDRGIKRKAHECALFQEHSAGGFFLMGGHKVGRWEQVEQLVRQWRFIKRTAEATPRPFMLRVRSRGWKVSSLLR
jgi:hypothetical protein